MKSFTTKRPTALAACLLALITTLPALAKEPTASFVESAGARARFDQARTYVRPEYLPTVSANANAAPSAAELASKLSAVAVAPDGRTFAANLSAAEIDLFVKAVKRHSGGSSGLHTGDFGEAVPLEGAGTGTVGAESVIGTDQRVRVTNTTTFPFNAIGRIAIGCTGTLIGPRHVLTAGHCVYNTTNNSWYSRSS